MTTELIRVVTLVAGGFALGLTLTVLVLYVRLHRIDHHAGAYRVPLIGVSHALLITAIEGEIVQHVANHDAFEWWFSPLASVAFALSIWALVEMLRSPQMRRLSNDVQAHGMR